MAGLEEDIGVAKGGQAIPFVVEDSEEGLCITEEARKALESMEGPLCVLCVVGGQGNGKSELMNRALFAHAENGFPVGGTQGIWMWSKPIPGTTSDGLDINILVMDAEGVPTEGCLSGSFEGGGAGVGKENPLHSISLLLSSFWVYMSLGGLSDAAVGDLASLAQGIARNVRMGPVGQEEVDVESMASCFPKLWWVLRDATPAQLVDDVGRNLTSRQYLERAVSGDVNSSFSQSKSRSRAIVRMCFEDRDCFPLAPAYEQSSPSASLGSPRTPSAGYLRQAQVLGGRVVQNADSKTINGVQVTGPMLALLADSYVTSANSGSHLSVKDAWDSVCDAECERSMAACAGVYERMAGSIRVESLPMPLYELTQWHTEAAGEALRMFEDQTKGREGAAKYRSLLEERLRGLFRGIDADNHHIGCLKAKEALEGLYSEVDARLHEGGYGEFGAYERDRARVRARFLEEVPRNMHSMLVLHEFMEEKLSGAATRFLTKTSEEADDSRQRLETEVEKMRFGVMQQQRGLERELEELKERLTLQEDYLAAGKARERELRESLTSEREKHSVEVAELGQAHSRALQDALRESDESERRRIDSEFRMREAESRLASLSERRAPVPKKRSSPATPDARKVEDAHVRDVLRQVCTSVRAAALNSRQTAERSRASASAFAPPQDAPPAAPEWREVEDEAGVLAWCEAALEAVASACEGVDRDAKATAKLVQDLSQACKVSPPRPLPGARPLAGGSHGPRAPPPCTTDGPRGRRRRHQEPSTRHDEAPSRHSGRRSRAEHR
uniref:GB1/RHD3-type G domain-containing protein n=1 Tax=Hemiselmis andersenii TaxID=464988 RepID=A0A7S1HAJ8_HEMAN